MKGISSRTKKAGMASDGTAHLMRLTFTKRSMPTKISSGVVPAGGTAEINGPKNTDTPKHSPQTIVLSPDLAPALMPAADSGEIKMGGPEKYPLRMVVNPQTMNSQLPLGILFSASVRWAKSDMDRAMPLNTSK